MRYNQADRGSFSADCNTFNCDIHGNHDFAEESC